MEPIREIEVINDVADFLLNAPKNPRLGERDHLLFMMGIFMGLRISHQLTLKVRDFRRADGKIIDLFHRRDLKAVRERKIVINVELKRLLADYVKDMQDHEYLFQSSKGTNKALKRESAYGVLKRAARAFNLDCIGCHTLRKTFGWLIYDATKSPVAVMKALGKPNVAAAMDYIGVNQDTVNRAIRDLRITRR